MTMRNSINEATKASRSSSKDQLQKNKKNKQQPAILLNQFSDHKRSHSNCGQSCNVASHFADISKTMLTLCSGGNSPCARVAVYKAGKFYTLEHFGQDQRRQQFLSYSKMLSIYVWHFKDVTSALKLFPLKLNVCGRARAEATVYCVPLIHYCVLSMHTGQRIILL